MLGRLSTALALAAAVFWSAPAGAQGTVKIGLILPFSGQFADGATQMDNGVKLYLQQQCGEPAGKKIEIIRKDVGGIAPDVARRLAQELVVRDNVDILAGFLLTPNAMAAGEVSQKAEKFMVVMNAATSIITTKSEYMARVSLTTPMLNQTLGAWAVKNGVKTMHTMVSDYGPGHDAEQAVHKGFTEAGGKIVGADRVPVNNPDFSSFVQRAKDSKADAIYVWVPGGAQPAAIGKALAERGVDPKVTKVFGQGELTTEEALASMGDVAQGIITVMHWDISHDSAKNKQFAADYKKAFNRNPDFFAIGGYDGMHLICESIKKTAGKTDAKSLIEAAKGMSWESPRGPISIDPRTRDIVQNVYIRRVDKVNGALVNTEFDKIDAVKDPVKEAMK